MKIALDAMGGDFAPEVNVQGAIEAVSKLPGLKVVLVGPEDILLEQLKNSGYKGEDISVFNASETVAMDESPSVALRKKKDSSMRRAVDLVKEGAADAVVSAGNSGAMMAMGIFILGRAVGVSRPAFGTLMPSTKKPFLLLDAGANVDCDPENLFQFALMGNAYSRLVYGVANPRVGILSIGEEPGKGNELTKQSYALLKGTDLNFIGNIESKEVFLGNADVVVCDGFVGNVFLKTSEGLADLVVQLLKDEIKASFVAKLGALLMSGGLNRVKKKTSYDEYGGAPLLGIKGACIICHGRSSGKAIMNAIRIASEYAQKRVYDVIADDIRRIQPADIEENSVAKD